MITLQFYKRFPEKICVAHFLYLLFVTPVSQEIFYERCCDFQRLSFPKARVVSKIHKVKLIDSTGVTTVSDPICGVHGQDLKLMSWRGGYLVEGTSSSCGSYLALLDVGLWWWHWVEDGWKNQGFVCSNLHVTPVCCVKKDPVQIRKLSMIRVCSDSHPWLVDLDNEWKNKIWDTKE